MTKFVYFQQFRVDSTVSTVRRYRPLPKNELMCNLDIEKYTSPFQTYTLNNEAERKPKWICGLVY